jgi:hypothetical protein
MFWGWFGRGKKILTIGSVHLDTIAVGEHSDNPDSVQTLAGEITHSIGGSAYNLAANLAHRQPNGKHIREVAVYTILPKHSVITELIRFKLRNARVSTYYTRTYDYFEKKKVRGGGYVAIVDMDIKDMRLAVIDAALGEADIFQNEDEADCINSAVNWADYLIADVNLSCAALDHLAEHARTNKKPLFMSLGSPEAAKENWLEGDPQKKALGVAGRSQVICKLLEHKKVSREHIEALMRFVDKGENSTRLDVNLICANLRARYVLCVHPSSFQGFALLAARDADPQAHFIPAEGIKAQKNMAGVVDAALSGFINTFARLTRRKDGIKGFERLDLRHPDFQAKLKHDIMHFVRDSARSEGATAGSVISFEEDTEEQGKLAALRRYFSILLDKFPTIRTAASILFFAVAIAAVVHQNWYYIQYWVRYIRMWLGFGS